MSVLLRTPQEQEAVLASRPTGHYTIQSYIVLVSSLCTCPAHVGPNLCSPDINMKQHNFCSMMILSCMHTQSGVSDQLCLSTSVSNNYDVIYVCHTKEATKHIPTLLPGVAVDRSNLWSSC